MKDEHHNVNDILKQGFKEIKLDSPSSDFTNDLMSEIHAINSRETPVYPALIPKPVKIGLALIFVCILGYFSLGADLRSTSIISTYFKLPEWSFNLPDLSFNAEFSNVVLYGLVFFMVLFSIQIYFIKTKVSRLKL